MFSIKQTLINYRMFPIPPLYLYQCGIYGLQTESSVLTSNAHWKHGKKRQLFVQDGIKIISKWEFYDFLCTPLMGLSAQLLTH